MSEISLSQFRSTLDDQIERQGQRNYEWDEGGTLVPTAGNAPPPTTPTRRPARPLPAGPSPLGIVAGALDNACNVRRLVGPGAFRNSTLPTAALSALSPGWRNTFDQAWDNLCGDSPGSDPTQVPVIPFTGGQCAGVRYNVQVFGNRFTRTGSTCNPTPWQSQIATFWGPIQGTRIRYTVNGGGAVEVLCRGPGSQTIRPAVDWVGLTSVSNSAGCDRATISSTSVSRTDGQPDTCGNPEPDYPDSGRIPPATSPINIAVGPNNVTITPTINFDIDEGAIEIDLGPELDVSFDGVNLDINIGGGGGSSNPGTSRPSPDDTATDPTDPPPPPPTNIDPNTDEEEPPPQVIRAVLVTVTQVNTASSIINGVDADLDNYFPDLGTVKFRVRAADGTSGFTNPIRVQNIRAFIVCPWDGGAFAVVGTPRTGVTWTLTPIYDVSSIPA